VQATIGFQAKHWLIPIDWANTDVGVTVLPHTRMKRRFDEL